MAILTVGPNSTFANIQNALASAAPGDTIALEPGYSNDIAIVTLDNITVQGDASSLGIQLQLAPGVATVQLSGTAPIDLLDNASGNIITGNGGDNEITVTGGGDAVDGGLGNDRLVIDYHTGTGDMTGTYDTGFVAADKGSVAIAPVTFEHFTILAGSGTNTLTTGAGDDYIVTAGAGANTITAGEGNNTIITGAGVDTIYVGNGNDTIFGGDGANTITGLAGDKVITTGAGADTITVTTGNNIINAGDGANTITVTGGNNTIIAGAGVDTITTTGGDNYIDAGAGANTIATTSGNDTIGTGHDTDTITTGAGDDTIIVSGGIDGVAAGAGSDTLVVDYSNATADVISTLPVGTDALGYAGSITQGVGGTVTYAAIEMFNITTGSGNDSIMTGDGNDTINTGAGADTVNGGGGADLIYGGAGDVIDGGEAGTDTDTLNLKDIGPYEVTYSLLNSENGTVHLLDANGVRTGESLIFTNIEQIVACFTPGTLIGTPTGARPVETLKKGDLVLTLDNGFKPIVWVGIKTLSPLQLSADAALQPISILRGALGHDRPNRDMTVSPQHRMLMSGPKVDLLFDSHEVLVRAKHLVSLPGISAVLLDEVTYVHIMFDQHEIVLADGAWSESFQPSDRSMAGVDADQRQELVAIFPELSQVKRFANYDAARQTLKSHEARVLLSA
jgi:Ca2+-binding RTX toxin-like protein